jgi:hypothetical protein
MTDRESSSFVPNLTVRVDQEEIKKKESKSEKEVVNSKN